MRFLLSCNLGEHISHSTLLLMASKMKKMRARTNTIIVKQDELSGNIYFVKSGKIRIVRDVVFHSPLSKYAVSSHSNAIFKEDPLNSRLYDMR